MLENGKSIYFRRIAREQEILCDESFSGQDRIKQIMENLRVGVLISPHTLQEANKTIAQASEGEAVSKANVVRANTLIELSNHLDETSQLTLSNQGVVYIMPDGKNGKYI